MGTIYVIKNTVTNRAYVGSTNAALKTARPQKHLSALRSNRHIVELMQEDFNKYGEASFSVNYLGDYSGQELKRMEIFMMQVLRTKDPRYGYNYKDKSGTSKYAIQDKWRTAPCTWKAGWRNYSIGAQS